MYHPMLEKFFQTFFQGDFPTKGKRIYLEHVAEVRRLVPPERLLEYSVSDGWRPLCKFLGKEEPKISFPRGNDIASFLERCQTRNRRQLLNVILQAFTWGVACFVVIVTGMVFIRCLSSFPREVMFRNSVG